MEEQGFKDVLEVTIRHFEQLSAQGVRSVRVSQSVLSGLAFAASPSNSHAPVAPRPTRQAPATPVPAGPAQPKPSPPIGTPWQPANLDPGARKAAFEQLSARARQCTRCPHLASSRRNVVFGTGNIDSELLFVGEAPGADEDLIGEPFVGKAGELLTKIIQAMGLSRDKVFIANVLKCRPDTPGQLSGNRKPTPSEMETCLPFLEEQIALIQPRVMVALGTTAIEGLLRRTHVQVTRLRGQWLEFHGIPLMPTFHPAYLLRNDSITEKRKVWEDMLAVMERLHLPISPKQRDYFRKAS